MFSYKTVGKSQDLRSRAEEETNEEFCKNHCQWPDHPCTSKKEESKAYNPGCCGEIAKTGDPMACSWPDRGWCYPDECASIPADVKSQRCGGPRESWCNLCKERGCGDSPNPTQPPPPPPTATPYQPPPTATLVPTVYVPPTTILLPTVIPTTAFIPTAPPTYITVIMQPTVIVLPTLPPKPTLTPTPTPKKITLPQILPPKEKIQTFWEKLKIQLSSFLTNILP